MGFVFVILDFFFSLKMVIGIEVDMVVCCGFVGEEECGI